MLLRLPNTVNACYKGTLINLLKKYWMQHHIKTTIRKEEENERISNLELYKDFLCLINFPWLIIRKYLIAAHLSIWHYHDTFWRTLVESRSGSNGFWQQKSFCLYKQRAMNKYLMDHLWNNGAFCYIKFVYFQETLNNMIIEHFRYWRCIDMYLKNRSIVKAYI